MGRKLVIDTGYFSIDYHGVSEVGNDHHGRYAFHSYEISNFITINGRKFLAQYKPGVSFIGDDPSCPSTLVELIESGDGQTALFAINNLAKEAIENMNEEEVFRFAAENDIGDIIESNQDLLQIYYVLKDNLFEAQLSEDFI